MSTQTMVRLASGQVIRAVNYRMDGSLVPSPAVPASPSPYNGGVYHLETAQGWVDVRVSDVRSITVAPGAMT